VRAGNRSRQVLGIAVGERSLSVAQISLDGDAIGTGPAPANFAYSDALSLEQGEALGMAMRPFLQQHGFTGQRAVLGVPAKWLICKSVNVPPADDATARQMLWLHAASQVAADLGPFTYDFLGEPDSMDPRDVLLLGLGNHWLDRLAALAAGAGLKVLAIRPTAVALARAAALRVGRPLVVCARPDGFDVIAQQHQHTLALRHVGPLTATQPLLAQVRRMLMVSPSPTRQAVSGDPQIPTPAPWDALVVWDEAGLAPAVLTSIQAAAAGLTMVQATLQWLSPPTHPHAYSTAGAAATALALSARAGGSGAGEADFLHPRLLPPRHARLPQRTLWLSAGAAAGVILIAALAAMTDLAWVGHQVAHADDQLQLLQPALARARPYVSTMQFASGYQTGATRYLACLGDLTLAIPDNGPTYLTSFSLDADMSGAAAGRASNEQDVLALLDKLRDARRFARLKCNLNQHQVQIRPHSGSTGPPAEAAPPPANGQPPGPHGAPPVAPPGAAAPPGPPPAAADVTFSLTFNYLPRA
jgi:hypothetical protein